MIMDLTMAVFLIGFGVTLVVAQPKTFSPPIPDHDCTVYKPGTYWHFINPYTGRCCEQIFVINGSNRICDTNGGQDQLVQCPKDSYNLNTPYFSGRFQFQEDAMELCDDNMVIDAYLNITWDYENFTTREGMSVVMRGTVHSSSDLTVAYLFKDNNSVPFRKMTCRNLKEENTWLAEQKLENLTLDCAGLYSILAVNTLTHARSRIARLTVLPKACQKCPTTVATPPNPTGKQDACQKCPTTVTTPPNSTGKQDGIGCINIYYILIPIPVVVVSLFLLYLIYRKNRRETLKKKQVEEDHDNDEKDNVKDTLMMNTQRGGQLETTV